MTDPLGQSQVLPYIVGLTKEGHSFTLISFEKKDRYFIQKDLIEQLCQENKIDWKPIFYTKNPPVLSTLFDLRNMSKLSYSLHKEKKFDLTHCRSYISSIVGLRLKRKFNVPFLFDMRGFWADERVDGELWNLKNPLYRIIFSFFKKKEIQFLTESFTTISLTHAGKEEIERWQLVNKQSFSPIEVIPCCTDLIQFPKVDRVTENVNLGYIGSLGTWYLLENMLRFFKIYQQYYPTAQFHFLTKDDPNIILEKALHLSINTSSILIEEANRTEIAVKVSSWNAAIFFIKPSYSKLSSSPVKQGELMAMGIPVFCNSGVGDTDKILSEYNSGILITEFNEQDYENRIIQFKKTNFDSDKIRLGAEDYFSLTNGINAYQKTYLNVS
jgi:glycosyltransferase involved in cell wall biosynthesis